MMKSANLNQIAGMRASKNGGCSGVKSGVSEVQ